MNIMGTNLMGVKLTENEAFNLIHDEHANLNGKVADIGLDPYKDLGQIVPEYTFMVVASATEVCTHDVIILRKGVHTMSLLTLKPMIFHWKDERFSEDDRVDDVFVGFAIPPRRQGMAYNRLQTSQEWRSYTNQGQGTLDK